VSVFGRERGGRGKVPLSLLHEKGGETEKKKKKNRGLKEERGTVFLTKKAKSRFDEKKEREKEALKERPFFSPPLGRGEGEKSKPLIYREGKEKKGRGEKEGGKKSRRLA